jgi:hypothetical protein
MSTMEALAPPPRPPLLARLNWYWILQGLAWTIATLLFAATFASVMSHSSLLGASIWTGASGLLLSDLWHRLIKARRWNFGGWNWRLVAGPFLLLAPVQCISVATAIHLLHQPVTSLAWLPAALIQWGGIFLFWNICYMAALALRRANRFESEALRLEVQAKDSELRALQAQVNPHFFFNSLNSVRALIYENPENAAQMIDQLASLMRYALQSGQRDTVPLHEELEAVQSYLAIEKVRFEERLRASISVEPGLENVMIPPMSLQTLVENAVKYGVELSATGSDIRIVARRTAQANVIEIANMGAILPFANSTHVGLANARKRLALAVGENASLHLSESAGWVRATLELPVAA